MLLSRFSRVRLCATPETAAHQAPPSLGFSRQEHWSGLPFPSPMHESEKWKGRHSVVSNSLQPHGLQPTRLLRPWDFPGKNTGVGCHFLLQCKKVKSESEVAQSCPTLCDPMNRSTPGLPVHHQLLEFTQNHVHWVGDAIQQSHSLLSPSPPAPNPSQWVNSLHEVAKVLEFQLQHQSFQRTPRTDPL